MELPLKNHHVNFGHVIIIGIFVLGQALSFWGLSLRYESRLSRMEDSAKTTADSVEKLTTLVRWMDENGTHKSQQGIQTDAQLSATNSHRIDTQELVLSQMVPKVERINTNLEWLMGKLKDTK